MIFSVDYILALAIAVLAALLLARYRAFLLLALFAVLPFPLSVFGESAAGNLSAADCLAASAFLMLLGSRRRLIAGGVGLTIVLYLTIAVVATLLSSQANESALALARMALATIVPVILFASEGQSVEVTGRALAAYVVGILCLFPFTLIAFVTAGFLGAAYTLDIHKNLLGSIYGCGLVITVCAYLAGAGSPRLRRWLPLPLAISAVGLVLSLSRGGWIATACGLLIVMAGTRRAKASLTVAALLVPLVVALWFVLPSEATDYAADVSVNSYTVRARFDVWDLVLERFRSSPILGVGIGLRREAEPHNVLVLTLGESGVVGLSGFLGMFIAGGVTFFRAIRRAAGDARARTVLVAGAAVFTVTFLHGLMDVYWRRGVGLMGWACVGTAVAVLRPAAPAWRYAARPKAGPKLGPLAGLKTPVPSPQIPDAITSPTRH